MKRKVKITFEIEELTYLKIRKRLTAFCKFCGKSVELLTMENVALWLNLSEKRIRRLIESGTVHFIESDKIYLCRSSIEIRSENSTENVQEIGKSV